MEPKAPDAPTKTRKPIRVWLLQLTCLLQAGNVGRIAVAGLIADGAPKTTDDLLWLGSAALAILLALTTLVAAQRWVPRPVVTAPVVGALWWLEGVLVTLRDELDADRRSPTTAVLVGGIIAHVVMLFFAVSLFAHRKTRDYLARR